MSATTKPSASPAGVSLQNTAPIRANRPTGWRAGMLHAIPNLIVFSMLAGVMYLGHHTGWKISKLSELTGTTKVAADDWCAEHLVPESLCIECQTDLWPKPKPLGFCREHGVAECVIHHPERAQANGGPRLPRYDTVQAIAVLPRPENNSRNTLHTHRVQFSSVDSIAKAGIEVDVVQERPMTDAITANGELMFDPSCVGHLSTRVPGTVAAVFKTLGDRVVAGEILALVDASQVGQTKSQLLQTVVQYQLKKSTADRLRPLSNSGGVPQKSIIEAEAALQEAEVALISSRQALSNLGFDLPEVLESADPHQLSDQLRFLGVPASVVSSLPAGTKTATLIPIRATYDGVITASDVVAGEVVDMTSPMFTVCDPERMWLMLHVRQEDAKYVRRGLPVQFRSDSGDQQVQGQIHWISPAIDQHTRTLQVRVVVANKDGSLRDKTFGTGKIVLREEANAIAVPREAVQSTPDAQFVFVRDKHYFDEKSPKFFHVRQVRLGATDGQFVELLAGVLPGEVIVSKGSNVLLAQLLRSNLGAGCGCHEH